MEDLRHDGISVGSVSRTVSKKKKKTLPRNFGARKENAPNSTSVCSTSRKHNTEEDALIYKREEQGVISSYVNHVYIFYSSILNVGKVHGN